MATEEIEISELEFTEELASDNLIPVESTTDTKATSLQILKNWLSSFFVGKTGDELISGVKTFERSTDFNGNISKILKGFNVADIVTSTTWFGGLYFKGGASAESAALMQIGKLAGGENYLNINIRQPNGDWTAGLDIHAKDSGSYVSAPASDRLNSVLTTKEIAKTAGGKLLLGNGILIQWGFKEFANTGTTVTFGKAFSTIYGVCFGHYQSGDTGSYATGVTATSVTNTNFTAHGWQVNSKATKNAYWLAIGVA